MCRRSQYRCRWPKGRECRRNTGYFLTGYRQSDAPLPFAPTARFRPLAVSTATLPARIFNSDDATITGASRCRVDLDISGSITQGQRTSIIGDNANCAASYVGTTRSGGRGQDERRGSRACPGDGIGYKLDSAADTSSGISESRYRGCGQSNRAAFVDYGKIVGGHGIDDDDIGAGGVGEVEGAAPIDSGQSKIFARIRYIDITGASGERRELADRGKDWCRGRADAAVAGQNIERRTSNLRAGPGCRLLTMHRRWRG